MQASKPTGDGPQTQICSSNAAESEGDQSKISDTKQKQKKPEEHSTAFVASGKAETLFEAGESEGESNISVYKIVLTWMIMRHGSRCVKLISYFR